MLVEVTAEHIRRGKKISCGFCPIALAIREYNPTARVYVEGGQVELNGDWYSLPQEARQFIHSFDRGFPVDPFSFILEAA